MTNPTFERAVSYLRLEERHLLKLRACVPHRACCWARLWRPGAHSASRAGPSCGVPSGALRYTPAAPPTTATGASSSRAWRRRSHQRWLRGRRPATRQPDAALERRLQPLDGGRARLHHARAAPPHPRHPWRSFAGSSSPLRCAAAALRASLRWHAVLRALLAGRLGPCARRRPSANCSCGLFWWHAVAHGLWRLLSHGCLPG
jgi:hypothetical protein